jgi:hypothetical protein
MLLWSLVLPGFTATAAGRILDDFEDGDKVTWQGITLGLGAVREQEGVLTLELPVARARRPVCIGSLRADETFPLKDGEAIEFRVQLVETTEPDTFAGLAWMPASHPANEFAGYFIAKSSREVQIGRALHKYFWTSTPEPALKHENIILVLRLTSSQAGVEVRGQVLDPEAGDSVLFDQTVLDSPISDALASGTDSSPGIYSGAGHFGLLAYADHALTNEIAEVTFDHAEVSTAEPTNRLPVFHSFSLHNNASFLNHEVRRVRLNCQLTDDQPWSPQPEIFLTGGLFGVFGGGTTVERPNTLKLSGVFGSVGRTTRSSFKSSPSMPLARPIDFLSGWTLFAKPVQ